MVKTKRLSVFSQQKIEYQSITTQGKISQAIRRLFGRLHIRRHEESLLSIMLSDRMHGDEYSRL